jgi:dienelactone hydrolase
MTQAARSFSAERSTSSIVADPFERHPGDRTMSRVHTLVVAIAFVSIGAAEARAQQRPFHYPMPPQDAVEVSRGVVFARVDSTTLAMAVYRPANASSASPALILYSLFWPEEKDRPPREANDQARSWARIAAGNGIIALVPDLRAVPGTGTASAPTRARDGDFDLLLTHLREHTRDYGIDSARLALFATSGSVAAALPAIEDPRHSAIKAAVLYYGGAGADVSVFRRDLPILWVRSGLDSRSMNDAIDRLARMALSQSAPVTVVDYGAGHHAFEAVDDTEETRRIIDRTVEFVKQTAGRR